MPAQSAAGSIRSAPGVASSEHTGDKLATGGNPTIQALRSPGPGANPTSHFWLKFIWKLGYNSSL